MFFCCFSNFAWTKKQDSRPKDTNLKWVQEEYSDCLLNGLFDLEMAGNSWRPDVLGLVENVFGTNRDITQDTFVTKGHRELSYCFPDNATLAGGELVNVSC